MVKRVEEFDLLDLDKPEVIGVVITKRNGKINVCPVNWQVTSTSYEKPPVVCVGLSNEHWTLENIKASNEFTYAYPSKDQLRDTLYCGTVSGRNIDKISHTSFKFRPAKYVSVPVLEGAVLNFECKLMKVIKLDNFSIVIGRVIEFYKSKKKSLDKIYSLGGSNYGVIDSIKVIQRERL